MKRNKLIVSVGLLLIGVLALYGFANAEITYVTDWGSYGTGQAEFCEPRDIAVDSTGNVYVADTLNDRIQKFDSTGTFVKMWGSNGTEAGELIDPSAIAVDSAGTVYVADVGNFRIQKFDSDGNLIPWADEDLGASSFSNPYGIAVDSEDNVYVAVADTDNPSIQKFDSTGGFLTMWGSWDTDSFDTPTGIATCSEFIYIADHDDELTNHRIVKFASAAIEAATSIHPKKLNLSSSGNYVTCYIELPEGYSVTNINVSTVAITKKDGVEIDPDLYQDLSELQDKDGDGTAETLMVKFDRQALIEELGGVVGDHSLTVTGKLTTGEKFEGIDTIRTK